MLARLLVAGIAVVVALAVRAAPALANPCTVTQDRSFEGKQSTEITFVNQTDRTVTVYWLNYAGQRIYYNTLNPSESYDQQTWVTHPWVVVDQAGTCLGYTTAIPESREFDITVTPPEGADV